MPTSTGSSEHSRTGEYSFLASRGAADPPMCRPARPEGAQIMNDYGVDFARIHAEGHDALARHAGPAIVDHLRNAGIRRGLVVDLGCGSGIVTRHLIGSGFDVLGVDPSPAMLQIARRRAPAATFVQRRAEDIELPTCVA